MFKKTYLSASISRALAKDHPIGDPFGGPAYGERNMPAVAVVAAVSSAATIAEVGIGSMMALDVVTAVGAIAAGVGGITGNESLSKIGAVMGIAGGVASFAQNKGWVDFGSLGKPLSESGLASSGGNTESLIKSDTAGLTQSASPSLDAAAPSATAGNDVTGSALSSSEAGSGGSISDSLAQTSGTSGQSLGTGDGLLNSTTTANAPFSGSQPYGGSGADPLSGYSSGLPSTAATAGDSALGTLGDAATSQNAPFSGYQPYSGLGGGSGAAKSIFDNLKNIGAFMKDNKEVSAAALYGVSKFFETNSDLSQAKTKEAQALADLYANRAAVEQQQVANANYIPNVSNQFALKPAGTTPFKTTTPTYRAPNIGLINSKV